MLLAVLFLLSWMVILLSPPINSIEQKWKQKREVGANIPETFPLLIITPGRGMEKYKAQIVEKKYMGNSLKENRNAPILFPKGRKAKDECLHNLAGAIDLILADRREDALRGLPSDVSKEVVAVG